MLLVNTIDENLLAKNEYGAGGLCKAPKCEKRGSRNDEGYCLHCFVNLFPDKKNKRNYKTKESTVLTHLKENLIGVTWVVHKRVKDGFSKRRRPGACS